MKRFRAILGLLLVHELGGIREKSHTGLVPEENDEVRTILENASVRLVQILHVRRVADRGVDVRVRDQCHSKRPTTRSGRSQAPHRKPQPFPGSRRAGNALHVRHSIYLQPLQRDGGRSGRRNLAVEREPVRSRADGYTHVEITVGHPLNRAAIAGWTEKGRRSLEHLLNAALVGEAVGRARGLRLLHAP